MKNRVYNLTTSFALPLLGWNRSVFQPYLINAYIRHEGVPHFQQDHLFVLLKWSADERFEKLTEVLCKHPTHISLYEPDDKGEFVMHVFKIRDELLIDYNKFLNGKYSQMSDAAKELIIGSAKVGGVTSQILKRDKRLREVQEQRIGVVLSDSDEVWSSIKDSYTITKNVFHENTLEELINQ